MKKIISIILSICMLFSITAGLNLTAFAYDFCGDFEYYLLNDGTARIAKYHGDAEELTIPSTLDGYTVTSIGGYSFEKCNSLVSVTIPDSVTQIVYNAFDSCKSLTDVVIPDSVTILDKGVFKGCSALTSITLPSGITEISDDLFDYCTSLTDVKMGNNIEFIGGAFTGCTSLTSFVMPDSVKKIGGYAFYNCSALESVVIPDSVESIGECVFENTALYNDDANWDNGVLYIGNHLIASNSDVPENYEIRNGTITIANCAFKRLSGLKNVIIPEGVICIGDEAFFETGLTSIVIPDSVTEMGNYAFDTCLNLESAVIGNGLTTLKTCVFEACSSLKSVTIGDGVEIIGYGAFCYCSGLTDVKMGKNVKTVGYLSFYRCAALESIVLPEGVEIIDSVSFSECTKLAEITIPDSLETIEAKAFKACFSLADVYYGGTEERWGNVSIDYTGNEYLQNATIHFAPDVVPEIPFADLGAYEAYDTYIRYTSVYNNFIKGTNPPAYTEFSPTTAITRAMFVTILYRMAGAPYDSGNPHKSTPFKDITNTSVYYYDAACWALDNGITTEKTFKPNDLVVREQTAAFLFRYASNNGFVDDSYTSVDLTGFTDFNTVSKWAVPAMQWANQQGMITGTQQGTLNPKGSTLRIHATKILYGFGCACGIGNGLPG